MPQEPGALAWPQDLPRLPGRLACTPWGWPCRMGTCCGPGTGRGLPRGRGHGLTPTAPGSRQLRRGSHGHTCRLHTPACAHVPTHMRTRTLARPSCRPLPTRLTTLPAPPYQAALDMRPVSQRLLHGAGPQAPPPAPSEPIGMTWSLGHGWLWGRSPWGGERGLEKQQSRLRCPPGHAQDCQRPCAHWQGNERLVTSVYSSAMSEGIS